MIIKRSAGTPARREARPIMRAGVPALLFAAFVLSIHARDLHVGIDPDVPSIHHAIKFAGPGDTIHLEAGKVYRDYAGFYDKKGEPGKPITLDGHGAILDGSEPLDPVKWKEVSPGLFSCDDLLPNLSDAVIGRWFFLWNGEMNRMGIASKATSEALKKPEELLPCEWTFVKDPSREKPPSLQIFGTFFLKLTPGRTLGEEKLFFPLRSAGVQFGGDNAHLVIRDLTARYPYNDGFNIHGDCREVVFEKIRAIGCGDDGISAHESAQYHVTDFISLGNSTGICDTGTATTSYENVFIADSVSVDLYFLDEGRYSLKNVVVFSSAKNPLTITGRATGECRMKMENVFFRRLVEARLGQIAAKAVLEASRCTFEGIDLRVLGTATFDNCLVNGKPSAAGASGADFETLSHLIPESHRP